MWDMDFHIFNALLWYDTIFYYSIRFYQFYYILALCAAIYPLLKRWIMSTPSILLFECIFRNLNSAILFTYIYLFWDTVPFSLFFSSFFFFFLFFYSISISGKICEARRNTRNHEFFIGVIIRDALHPWVSRVNQQRRRSRGVRKREEYR